MVEGWGVGGLWGEQHAQRDCKIVKRCISGTQKKKKKKTAAADPREDRRRGRRLKREQSEGKGRENE